MEHGGENLGLHEDDIYDNLPAEYQEYFEPENTMAGNRAGHEFATPLQRSNNSKGGFGFGYHNEIKNGTLLFVERWIPSNPPDIDGWDKLKQLAEKKDWPIIVSARRGATSILIGLNHDKMKKVIDTIIAFLDTISKEEHNLPFLEAAQEIYY
jgi:hypothetical protein